MFEKIYATADFIESFAVSLKEAARRADRLRAHGYVSDIVRSGKELTEEYGRIAALAKLGGQK